MLCPTTSHTCSRTRPKLARVIGGYNSTRYTGLCSTPGPDVRLAIAKQVAECAAALSPAGACCVLGRACVCARKPARAAPAAHAPWLCARSKHAWRVNAWPRGCSTTLLPVVSLATSRSWLRLRGSAFGATTAVTTFMRAPWSHQRRRPAPSLARCTRRRCRRQKMQGTAFLAPTSRARVCQRPAKGQKARQGLALQREITQPGPKSCLSGNIFHQPTPTCPRPHCPGSPAQSW
jgi:hypothetical protein